MGQAPSALENCINAVGNGRTGFVGYPRDPFYQITWVKPYNLDVSVTPAAVVRPQTAQDISQVIQCANANGKKVQAKSGGHSYANYGLGGDNGAVAIDMVNFQHFRMDNLTWQATVGAGTRLGEVTKKMHDAGGRAMAHGVCPDVGTGGHATIGGLGPMSRMWGSCLDHVLEVEVVTADGKIQRASNTQNTDLFWALSKTKDFVTGFHNQILAKAPAGTKGTYAGYVDPALTDGQQQYWGTNLGRLMHLKSKWDAGDLFRNPQSVRLPGSRR